MGSCIARCFCEVGKCFCCDCLVIGSNLRHLRDSISRRGAANKRTNSFSLRRQSSSANIEFENLMFDFDLPDTSNQMMQMRAKSVSNWLSKKDRFKQTEFEIREMSTHFVNPLSKYSQSTNTDFTQINTSEDTSRELPIIDSLITRITQNNEKHDSLDLKDKISLGGASSMGELQWENEIIEVEEGMESNGMELEWDDYEQSNIGVTEDTDQLILEIEELTKSTIK